jgi:hypothetical protein
MSNLLSLARDYIDRMSNPSYGFATNEDYSLRFAQLLGAEEFEASLHKEISGLRDKEALTSNGWLWLIRWARSRQIEMQEDLLVELFEEWSSVPARCAIVDLATYRSELQKPDLTLGDFPLGNFPDQFLNRIMQGATETRKGQRDDRSRPEPERLTARVEDVLVVFLQVGSPLTLAAASALLRHRWQGHEQLTEYLRVLASTLDAETRDVWSKQLGVRLSQE